MAFQLLSYGKREAKKKGFFLDIRGKDWIGDIEKGNPRACSSSSVSSGYGKRRNIYSDYKPISPERNSVRQVACMGNYTCNDGLWIFFRKGGGGDRPWAEMVKSTCQNKCMCVSAYREGKYLGNRWTFRKKSPADFRFRRCSENFFSIELMEVGSVDF